jgi:hypothetical protein
MQGQGQSHRDEAARRVADGSTFTIVAKGSDVAQMIICCISIGRISFEMISRKVDAWISLPGHHRKECSHRTAHMLMHVCDELYLPSHGVVRLIIVQVAQFRRPLGIFSSAAFVSAIEDRC